MPLKYTTEKLNFFYLHSYMKIFQAKRKSSNPKPFPEGRVDFCGAKRRDERYILPYCFSLPPSRQQRLVLFSCFCTAEPPPSSDGGLIGARRRFATSRRKAFLIPKPTRYRWIIFLLRSILHNASDCDVMISELFLVLEAVYRDPLICFERRCFENGLVLCRNACGKW